MTKYCPSCGEELVDNAKFCKNCGHDMENINPQQDTVQNQQPPAPVEENEHKIAVIAGYVLAILIPLFGLIAGIYLITRNDSQYANKHGKYVIIVSVLIWIISFASTML